MSSGSELTLVWYIALSVSITGMYKPSIVDGLVFATPGVVVAPLNGELLTEPIE